MFSLLEPLIPYDCQMFLIYCGITSCMAFLFCSALFLITEIAEPTCSTYEYCNKINQFISIETIATITATLTLFTFGFWYSALLMAPFAVYQIHLNLKADWSVVKAYDIYREEYRKQKIRYFGCKLICAAILVLLMLVYTAMQLHAMFQHDNWGQILPFVDFLGLQL